MKEVTRNGRTMHVYEQQIMGLRCVALQFQDTFHWCGYVEYKDRPEKEYNFDECQEITFTSDRLPTFEHVAGMTVVGFDCAHACDRWRVHPTFTDNKGTNGRLTRYGRNA